MSLKKIRLLFLIVGAFWKKEKKVVVATTIAAAGLFFLSVKVMPYVPRPKPTERIGVIGNYTFESLPEQILSLSSSGLTKIDENGLPIPSLADKWTVSEDGKSYSFYLAENIFWQDGTEVAANEIKFDLPNVETEIISNKVIKFNLQEPYSPFPTLLTKPIFKKNSIGTGRYQVKKIEKSGPYIRRLFLAGPDINIVYSFYPIEDAAFWAFKIGEIDQMPAVFNNPFEPEWFPFVSTETSVKKNQYIGIFLNMRDKYLADKNLRQALAYATLKPNDETRAIGPINPDSWAFNPDVKLYEADVKQAKNLFSKFINEIEEEKITLRIDTTNNFQFIAEQIKNNWEEALGINVEIKFMDRIPSDFQVLLIISEIPADPDQYTFWHSTQESNLTGYKSPKVDKILEDARQLTDTRNRKEKYYDFQKFILEDSPVIFLYHPQILTIKRNKFRLPFAVTS